MHIRRWWTAALLCLAVSVSAGRAWAENCQVKRLAALPFYSDPSGRIAVPVRIDDRIDLALILDTGDFFSVLGTDTADVLHLRKSTAGFSENDLYHHSSNTSVTPESVQLDHLKARRPQFMLLDDRDFFGGFDGLFGGDFLANYDLDLDFGQDKAYLVSQDHCPGHVVYWTNSYTEEPIKISRANHILLEVRLNGQPVRAMLDTGAPTSVISEHMANELAGADRSHADQPGAKRETVQLQSIEFAGVTFHNSTVGVLDSDFGDGAVMLLGMRQLRQLHLYIAYAEGKLYVSPLDEAALTHQHQDEQILTDCIGPSSSMVPKQQVMGPIFEACNKILALPGITPWIQKTALLHRGWAYEVKGDFDHALADLNELLRIDPKSWPAFEARSRVARSKGAYADAVIDLDQAIAIVPDRAFLYEDRGYQRWHLGDAAGAFADYDRGIELDPKLARGWNLRCLARAVKGVLDQAAADCAKALELAPGSVAILDSRAYVRLQSGQLDAAIADYNTILAQSRELPKAFYGRSLAKERKGDSVGAAADRAAAMKLDPTVATDFALDP